MRKVLIFTLILYFCSSLAFAQVRIINLANTEPFERKVNSLQTLVIKDFNNKENIEKYVNALSIRSFYYKKVKKNLEKSSDDIRSALFFLSEDKGSDRYKEYSKRLANNLTDMNYFPSNSDRLELAKNLFWEEQYFASAFEFEQLSAIGYEEYICYEFLGDIYQKINKLDYAIKYYDKSIKKYPKNADVTFKLAKLYEKLNQKDYAQEKYRQTASIAKDRKILDAIISVYTSKIQTEPNNPNNYEILALAYRQENNFPQTYSLLNKALFLSPSDTTLKYMYGNILYDMKEYNKAIEIYNSILSNNLYESQIRIAKAKSLMNLGRKQEGIKEFQIVLAIYADSKQAQYGIYRALYGMPLDEIAKSFYPLNKNYIPTSDLYKNLGDFAQDINQISDAITFYRQSIIKNSKNTESYIGLYKTYELNGNKYEALETIKNAYKNLPSNKEIAELYADINKDNITRKNELALSYFKNNDFIKALKIYEQIIPKTSATYLSIANCHTILKDYKSARVSLEAAIKIDPVNSDIYYALALNFLEQNSPQSAKRVLTKAIALNKNNLKAVKLLNSITKSEINAVLDEACAYYDKKDYTKALEILNNAFEKYGGYIQLFYYRGTIYEAQGKYMDALSDYKKVTEIDNNYDIVYYSLGNLFEKIGKGRDALSAYERYLSGNPQEEDYIKKAQKKVIELGNKYY